MADNIINGTDGNDMLLGSAIADVLAAVPTSVTCVPGAHQGSSVVSMPPALRSRLGLGRSFQDGRLFPHLSVARNLELEGEAIVRPAAERPGFAKFQFGLTDEDVEISRQPLPIETSLPIVQNGPISASSAMRALSSTLANGSIAMSPLVPAATGRVHQRRVYASSLRKCGHELLRMMTG